MNFLFICKNVLKRHTSVIFVNSIFLSSMIAYKSLKRKRRKQENSFNRLKESSVWMLLLCVQIVTKWRGLEGQQILNKKSRVHFVKSFILRRCSLTFAAMSVNKTFVEAVHTYKLANMMSRMCSIYTRRTISSDRLP